MKSRLRAPLYLYPRKSLVILALVLSLPGCYCVLEYFSSTSRVPAFEQVNNFYFLAIASLFFLASTMLIALGAIAELLLENQRLLDQLLSREITPLSARRPPKATRAPQLKLVGKC